MHKRQRVAVLASGTGTTMRALVEASRKPDFPAEMVVVVADRDCPAVTLAGELGVPVEVVDYRLLGRKPFEAELATVLHHYAVDYVCLAGFMCILGPQLVKAWKILNIHPSLLPDFKGLNVHARVLAAGKTETGCTVHHVAPELDAGPVVLQRRVPVKPNDTPATLEARVKAAERLLYPEALRLAIARDKRPTG